MLEGRLYPLKDGAKIVKTTTFKGSGKKLKKKLKKKSLLKFNPAKLEWNGISWRCVLKNSEFLTL